MVGTADSVLIREVSLIQSVLYREVPLYISHTDNTDNIMDTVYMSVSHPSFNVGTGECKKEC